MAAPLYDFTDPTLKPWHLKATYQLYDQEGKPAEQGTFEYWWASPKVYRSTWKRQDAIHTDWHTADDKHAYEATGEGPSLFEMKLQRVLLSPLSDAEGSALANSHLVRQDVKLDPTNKVPCIMITPKMLQYNARGVPLGLFPTYCFDPKLPIIRSINSFGTLAILFNKIAKVQGRYLPMEVGISEGSRQILTAKVDSVEYVSPIDPAFAPVSSATFPKTDRVSLSPTLTAGMLQKKVVPIYPGDAKDAHVSGTVLLHALIGRDGRVHDIHVVQAPWPSLVASAIQAVSQWEYKPYLINGEPVEVDTFVSVIFTLGG
jgi:TonB family protein